MSANNVYRAAAAAHEQAVQDAVAAGRRARLLRDRPGWQEAHEGYLRLCRVADVANEVASEARAAAS